MDLLIRVFPLLISPFEEAEAFEDVLYNFKSRDEVFDGEEKDSQREPIDFSQSSRRERSAGRDRMHLVHGSLQSFLSWSLLALLQQTSSPYFLSCFLIVYLCWQPVENWELDLGVWMA